MKFNFKLSLMRTTLLYTSYYLTTNELVYRLQLLRVFHIINVSC